MADIEQALVTDEQIRKAYETLEVLRKERQELLALQSETQSKLQKNLSLIHPANHAYNKAWKAFWKREFPEIEQLTRAQHDAYTNVSAAWREAGAALQKILGDGAPKGNELQHARDF